MMETEPVDVLSFLQVPTTATSTTMTSRNTSFVNRFVQSPAGKTIRSDVLSRGGGGGGTTAGGSSSQAKEDLLMIHKAQQSQLLRRENSLSGAISVSNVSALTNDLSEDETEIKSFMKQHQEGVAAKRGSAVLEDWPTSPSAARSFIPVPEEDGSVDRLQEELQEANRKNRDLMFDLQILLKEIENMEDYIVDLEEESKLLKEERDHAKHELTDLRLELLQSDAEQQSQVDNVLQQANSRLSVELDHLKDAAKDKEDEWKVERNLLYQLLQKQMEETTQWKHKASKAKKQKRQLATLVEQQQQLLNEMQAPPSQIHKRRTRDAATINTSNTTQEGSSEASSSQYYRRSHKFSSPRLPRRSSIEEVRSVKSDATSLRENRSSLERLSPASSLKPTPDSPRSSIRDSPRSSVNGGSIKGGGDSPRSSWNGGDSPRSSAPPVPILKAPSTQIKTASPKPTRRSSLDESRTNTSNEHFKDLSSRSYKTVPPKPDARSLKPSRLKEDDPLAKNALFHNPKPMGDTLNANTPRGGGGRRSSLEGGSVKSDASKESLLSGRRPSLEDDVVNNPLGGLDLQMNRLVHMAKSASENGSTFTIDEDEEEEKTELDHDENDDDDDDDEDIAQVEQMFGAFSPNQQGSSRISCQEQESDPFQDEFLKHGTGRAASSPALISTNDSYDGSTLTSATSTVMAKEEVIDNLTKMWQLKIEQQYMRSLEPGSDKAHAPPRRGTAATTPTSTKVRAASVTHKATKFFSSSKSSSDDRKKSCGSSKSVFATKRP